MAYEGNGNSAELSVIFESLQSDFKTLSGESKKKYPQVKEACEEAIAKLKGAQSSQQISANYVVNQIIYPLSQGCETKDVKLIRLCLQIMQKLIKNQVVDQKGALYITDTLWSLMELGIEEVKILQTVTLLLTTNTVVHGETLARTLVLCFRLHFTKNSTTINTAGATVRQLVYLVFERVVAEEEQLKKSEKYTQRGPVNTEELKIPSSVPPKGLPPCAGDAFLLFHDLVQLVNADQPYWLIGMTEMTRTFGLELLESVLTQFSSVFHKNAEFSFLLKERVCALVIKLFSPNIKYRSNLPSNTHQATPFEKPYFPISMRLLRVVSILIQKYHELLVTECEIFLSLIVKFLDPDKPTWQRSLALEVLHKMTVQPELLRSFCECYDLNAHTTSIFQDMVNSLGAYVQSLFVNPQLQMGIGIPAMQGQPPVHLAGLSAGPGISAQSGFLLRGVWLPIVVTFPTGQAKSTYLEMLDKVEPPTVPDGYGISVAYACLVETIRSLQIVITPQRPPDGQEGEGEGVEETEKGEADREVDRQLVNSSWCGLLAALAPLVEASTEEAVTENVLKAIQTYTSLCGVLDLQMPRDAFITAICKSSLPPHYALSVLNSVTSGINLRQGHRDSQDLGVSLTLSYGDTDYRQQVVAVGTPLPTTGAPAGAHQGPVMLTAKNLQAMRALLSLAHCHGGILGSSWHLVLTTLQHLVWILGLKPSTGGSLKAVRPASDTNAVITSSVMDNLPVLSTMLSKLFESSRYLDDVALHHLISALCKLSQEAMELAYANREPSLFAVAKLLETGLVNMPRIEVLWRPLTNHLLEVCHHPHIRMRGWGVEAITYLVKAALNFNHAVPLRENQKMQTLLLGPLYELSSVLHGDVRQKQLECVLQILHTNGETLSHGWPLILGIIGAVNDQHGEHLVKIAFQCLQLVITDFLPLMPWRCLPLCVDTVAKFGSQTQELNISLTAVGLMWNISDYFYQNQGKLNQATTEDNAVLPDFPGTLNVSSFDKLWMCLYARLGELCVDSRPAVRKSSGQTLFSTIAAHGGLLRPPTWQIILWQVLFPLLDKVRSLSNSASSEKFDTGGNILIHHTRNTAQKQWAETQVLTLSGVARVFNTKRQLLALGDFPRAWSILLEFIENAALSRNNEVSIAALKSFQEILFLSKNQTPEDKTVLENREIWAVAWKIWVKIGVEMTDGQEQEELYLPSQTFLTTLVQIFPYVFQNVKNDFTLEDLRKFGTVLTNAVSVPVLGETTPPYVISASSDLSLTPLHDGVLHAVELVQKEAMSRNESRMLPDIFRILLTFAQYTCQPPVVGKHAKTADWVVLNYVPFGEKAVGMVAKLYERTAEIPEVIEAGVLEEIVRTLRTPLALKYNCVSASVWKLAAGSLMAVLRCGLKVARAQTGRFGSMWDELYGTLNDFLFPSTCAPGDKGLDDLVTDEAMDCQFIELLRTEVLPHSKHIPDEFIMQVVILLNKGSIHSATNVQTDGDTEITLREEFAKTCFETLLQFSLVDEETGERERREGERREGRELREGRDGDMAGHLAVTSLLHRFQEVLGKYIEDEKLSGKCPLPRYRLSEISFVLKALTTLIISMKKSTAVKEDNKAWEQLISLYPYLVECTTTSSMQVSRPLKEALLQFCDLLQPPHNKNNNNVIRLTDSLI